MFDSTSRNLKYACANIKTRWILFWFFLVILSFAGAYCLLTIYFPCIGKLESDKSCIDFFSCTYFSIVTISSLGYGDILPFGLCRFLACAEVLIGFLFFGIIVGKLSTAKQEYWLKRVYNATSIQNIRGFSATISNSLESHQNLQKEIQLLNNGQAVSVSNLEKINFISRYNSINKDLKETVRVIQDYLYYESTIGEIIKDLPGGPINIVFNDLDKILDQWRSQPKWLKSYIIKSDLFVTPNNIIRMMQNILLTIKNSGNGVIRERAADLDKNIQVVLALYQPEQENT